MSCGSGYGNATPGRLRSTGSSDSLNVVTMSFPSAQIRNEILLWSVRCRRAVEASEADFGDVSGTEHTEAHKAPFVPRTILGEDHSGSVVLKGLLDHFPRVH